MAKGGKKSMWWIIGSIMAIAIVVGSMLLFTGCGEKPPEPEIKRGEFSFKLVYEISGVEKIIEDTFICEFDDYFWSTRAGWERQWKESYASGREKIILWNGENVKSISLLGNYEYAAYQDVYFDLGSAGHYMGDQEHASYYPCLMYYERPGEIKDGNSSSGRLGGDWDGAVDAYERFGIRVISWECDPPIVNTFK